MKVKAMGRRHGLGDCPERRALAIVGMSAAAFRYDLRPDANGSAANAAKVLGSLGLSPNDDREVVNRCPGLDPNSCTPPNELHTRRVADLAGHA